MIPVRITFPVPPTGPDFTPFSRLASAPFVSALLTGTPAYLSLHHLMEVHPLTDTVASSLRELSTQPHPPAVLVGLAEPDTPDKEEEEGLLMPSLAQQCKHLIQVTVSSVMNLVWFMAVGFDVI